MKNLFKNLIIALLIFSLCITLSSCSIFKTMRENALEASLQEILTSPDDEAVIDALSEFVKTSITKSTSEEQSRSVKENINYSVNDISVMSGEEKAGLLADSAKQLKSLIMNNKPGSSSREITLDDVGLLGVLDDINAVSVNTSRNMTTEKITDDKGNAITNENSEELTTEYISDNILHLTLNFFDTEITESVTDEEGSVEEITTVLGLDNETIESVFGDKADKDAVLKEFDVVKDYIDVEDYDIEYTDCKIATDIVLNESVLNFVNFEKNMIVTAKVKGVGALENYGDITVSFKLTKTTNYSFAYAAEE